VFSFRISISDKFFCYLLFFALNLDTKFILSPQNDPVTVTTKQIITLTQFWHYILFFRCCLTF